MEAYSSFDIIVVPFPFTDRATQRRRPALVLSSADFAADSGHVICAMVTTAKRSAWKSDIDLEQWAAAGLPEASKVRMKCFTLDCRLVLRVLGRLAPVDAKAVHASFDRVMPLTC